MMRDGSRRASAVASTFGRGRRDRRNDGRPRPPARCRSSPTQGARTTRMPGPACALQFVQQLFGAQHRAGQRIADANGQRRDIGLALLHHVEMRVEGRGLEHLGERQLHLVGKRGEMRRGDLVILVLDQVQMLDQEIAPPRPVAEQQLDLVRGGRIDLAALGRGLGPLASLRPDARTRGPCCTS